MSVDRVKSLMKEAGWGALATTNGKTVGCRPMGGWAWFGEELWCATSGASEKVAQLRAVPYAAYCFCKPEGVHVRKRDLAASVLTTMTSSGSTCRCRCSKTALKSKIDHHYGAPSTSSCCARGSRFCPVPVSITAATLQVALN